MKIYRLLLLVVLSLLVASTSYAQNAAETGEFDDYPLQPSQSVSQVVFDQLNQHAPEFKGKSVAYLSPMVVVFDAITGDRLSQQDPIVMSHLPEVRTVVRIYRELYERNSAHAQTAPVAEVAAVAVKNQSAGVARTLSFSNPTAGFQRVAYFAPLIPTELKVALKVVEAPVVVTRRKSSLVRVIELSLLVPVFGVSGYYYIRRKKRRPARRYNSFPIANSLHAEPLDIQVDFRSLKGKPADLSGGSKINRVLEGFPSEKSFPRRVSRYP